MPRVDYERHGTDCVDYWNRPGALLDPDIRSSQSMWPLLPAGAEERIAARLGEALQSGAWDAEHGHLRGRDSFDGSLRLVIAEYR